MPKKRRTHKGQSSNGEASDGKWRGQEKRKINYNCLLKRGFTFDLTLIEEEEGGTWSCGTCVWVTGGKEGKD